MASAGMTESERLEQEIAQLQERRQALAAREARERAVAEQARAGVLVDASPAKRGPTFKLDSQAAPPPRQPVFAAKPRPEGPLFRTELPAQSSLSNALASIRSEGSPSFGNAVAGPSTHKHSDGTSGETDDVLWKQNAERVLDRLVLGAQDFSERKADWEKVEPYSKLRLSDRVLSHDQVQANMEGRYHVQPSDIYATMELKRNKTGYDLPLDAEWVTIGVVVEVKTNTFEVKDKEHLADNEEPGGDDRPKKTWKSKTARVGERKGFTILRLTTLPTKAQRIEGREAGGDALLDVLMYEADETHKLADGTKTYSGGSKGAYEEWRNLELGSVIALVSPSIRPPYKTRAAPNPYTTPVGVMVTSHKDLWVIGRSLDVMPCRALTKKGYPCDSWYDKRAAKSCEYHTTGAIDRTRKGRAEFSSSTSGFQAGWFSKPKAFGAQAEDDDEEKSGSSKTKRIPPAPSKSLLSRFGAGSMAGDGGGQTYVFEGSLYSAGRVDPGVGDSMGRAKDERLKRKREAAAAERDLQQLLDKDGGRGLQTTGGKYLEAAKRLKADPKAKSGTPLSDPVDAKPRPFHAEAVKKLGFDPSREGRPAHESTAASKKRLEAIAILQAQKGPIRLGRLPGKSWSKSSVRAPPGTASVAAPGLSDTRTPPESELLVDLDSEEDDE